MRLNTPFILRSNMPHIAEVRTIVLWKNKVVALVALIY